MKNYRCEWRGPVGLDSGLGIASKAYMQALIRQGVSVRRGSREPGIRPARGSAVKQVLIYHYLPHSINMAAERKHYDRIILNTVWETTRIPNSWKPYMNQFDAVFVPSRQNKRALLDSGVKVPIFIIPHGVNTSVYRPDYPKPRLAGYEGRFVFVSVFGFQHRKNPEGLLRAYWEEFSEKDRVLLFIKTSGCGEAETEASIKSRIQRYKESLGLNKKTAPVMLLGRHVSQSQMKGIYRLGDAFVLPTRGEGVGLPFLESLASGVPVIATGWGGHMDFLNGGNSFPISYKLKNPGAGMSGRHVIAPKFSHIFAQKGQLWAEPELSDIRRKMRAAYGNPLLCKRKGQKGRQDMLRLSWDRSGRLMKQAIERVLKMKRQ
jgi:glycosyltransferase involved in cell wall biosynthesis